MLDDTSISSEDGSCAVAVAIVILALKIIQTMVNAVPASTTIPVACRANRSRTDAVTDFEPTGDGFLLIVRSDTSPGAPSWPSVPHEFVDVPSGVGGFRILSGTGTLLTVQADTGTLYTLDVTSGSLSTHS